MEKPIQSHEMTFVEIVRAVTGNKRLIGLCTFVCMVLAATYAFMAPKIYRSEAIVQPREQSPSGLGMLTGTLVGVADLAGLGVERGDRAVALATLMSRSVVEAFIRDNGLLQQLYESDWDLSTGAWKVEPAPTVWEAYGYFTENVLALNEDRRSDLVTVSIQWKDPKLAQQWTTELIARTNQYLKVRAIEEGERNLMYLEGQSRKVGQVELQQALFNLVETEHKRVMVAKGAEEFALRTIDPAVVPTRHFRPKRLLIISLGLVVGVMSGVALALSLSIWRRLSS